MQFVLAIVVLVSLVCAAALVPLYRRALRRHARQDPAPFPPQRSNVIPFENYASTSARAQRGR